VKGMSLLEQFVIALRNIVKNRRRSVLTILSVTIGFVALSLFEGYFFYIYRILEDQAIIGERLGHVTFVKRGFYEEGMQEPRDYAFDAGELEQATRILADAKSVKLVSPRLSVSGLISNGRISRIFVGDSITASDMDILRGEEYADLPGRLSPDNTSAGVFGDKLAHYLDADVGDVLTLVASTIDGMVNAVDIEVGEATTTGTTSTDDKSLLMSLELARKLLLFDGADRIVVLFHDKDAIATAAPELMQRLADAGFDVEYREWRDLSQYYGQVKGLFDAMYLFISLVVAVVVMFSVANTIGMSISERTREIGTLRALGLRRRNVSSLFVMEGLAMVAAGVLIGVALTYIAGYVINAADITYIPPDSSVEADLKLDLIPANLFGSAFTLIVLAVIVSWLPARRAGRLQIVDALGHV
jgi:putative ABC transport system permease protein